AHSGKIDSFIADAGGLPAIADPGEASKFFSLKARTERDAGHYGKQITQHGDGRNHVALLGVAVMRGPIIAVSRRSGLGHVLHHDVTGVEAADQLRALVADHGSEPVFRTECVSGGARARLLSQAKVNTTDNFALLVQIFESDFHAPVHHHPAVELNTLLFAEVLRFADGRDRGIELARDFVVNLGA